MEQEQKKLTITCVYICKENGMVAICEQEAKELPKGKDNQLEWKKAVNMKKRIKHIVDVLLSLIYKASKEEVKEIIEYYNQKFNKRLKPEVYRDLIDARFREGANVEDFKTVIDNKAALWLTDKKMASNLKPSTLFRKCHFDEYINQVEPVDKNKLQSSPTYDLNGYAEFAMTNTEI